MGTRRLEVRRRSVVCARPFDEVVAGLAASIGHPDLEAFHGALVAAAGLAELEALVRGAIGASGLMEFARYDAGEVLRKGRDGPGPRILRLVVGNPLVMRRMVEAVPDAAAWAP